MTENKSPEKDKPAKKPAAKKKPAKKIKPTPANPLAGDADKGRGAKKGDGFEGPPESNRKPPQGEKGETMHGAKPHVKLTPAQVEAIQETLDRITDLAVELGPAKKKLDEAKEKADRAAKAVAQLNADRTKLLNHLVDIRSGTWQTRLALGD